MSMGFANTIDRLLPPLKVRENVILSKGDVLIHAPGFEKRTMAVAEGIVATCRPPAVLLEFHPYKETNRILDVKHALTTAGVQIEDQNIVVYDRFDPRTFEEHLTLRLRATRARRAVIDISTMSKLQIILVLRVCTDLRLRIKVMYTEAETYGPSKQEFEDAKKRGEIHRPSLQVFSGIHGVIRVSSLSSTAMQGQSTAALVFMSFNDALTQVLLNYIYPGRLLLINGRPPEHAWREEATAWIHDQVRQEWPEDNPTVKARGVEIPLPKRSVSTLDYRETVKILVELYWDLSPTHRILLAPAGSKLQAVGCYIAKALHPDIHIEYPSPEGFQPTYSDGVGTHWLLDFGDFSELIGKISRAERKHFLELE